MIAPATATFSVRMAEARAEAARQTPAHAQRILRLPDVELRTGLRKSSLYDRMKAGDFPQSVRLGARARGWLSSEVDEWIAATAARRA